MADYIRTPKESPVNIRADLQRRITDTLEIAQKMGGTVILLKNEDVADALISFAKEYGITHIVLGRPSAKKIPNPFKRSLHERLIRELPDVQIVVA
jgi:two-component system sensor histidine kinase KdpD